MKRIAGGGMLCVLGTGNVGVHAFRSRSPYKPIAHALGLTSELSSTEDLLACTLK